MDAAVGQALDGTLLPRARPGHLAEPLASLPRALACLGAVAAALAMRAHPRTQARLSAPVLPVWLAARAEGAKGRLCTDNCKTRMCASGCAQDAVAPALAVLEAAAAPAGAAEGARPALARGLAPELGPGEGSGRPQADGHAAALAAAAGIYEALVGGRAGGGGAAVAHAVTRVLWQQRAFAGALQPLLQARGRPRPPPHLWSHSMLALKSNPDPTLSLPQHGTCCVGGRCLCAFPAPPQTYSRCRKEEPSLPCHALHVIQP